MEGYKLLDKGEQMEIMFGDAVEEEIERHRVAGVPIAVYRDGKVVIIPPEKIIPRLKKKARRNLIRTRIRMRIAENDGIRFEDVTKAYIRKQLKKKLRDGVEKEKDALGLAIEDFFQSL